MERRCGADFLKVRPNGQDGDWSCDGIWKSRKQLYQVFAPKDLEKAKSDALAKIDHDFTRAVKMWGGSFETWVFVHNGTDGIPPSITKKLVDLDGTSGKKVENWSPMVLRQLVFDLSDSDIATLLGPPFTTQSLSTFGADHIRMVVTHIAKTVSVDQEVPLEVAPRKLEFNKLSDWSSTLIKSHFVKAPRVAKFFAQNSDPTLRDQIATTLNGHYRALRSAGMGPDQIFAGLWEYTKAGDDSNNASVVGASLSVLAYFFESCDIFEPPPLEDTGP